MLDEVLLSNVFRRVFLLRFLGEPEFLRGTGALFRGLGKVSPSEKLNRLLALRFFLPGGRIGARPVRPMTVE